MSTSDEDLEKKDDDVIDEDEIEDEDSLEMSDEEFAKLEEPPVVIENKDDDPDDNPDEEIEDIIDGVKVDKPEKDDLELEPDTGKKDLDKPEESAEEKKDKPDEKSLISTDSEDEKIDSDSELKKIMAPFKANGVDMQMRSADDVITLMQMGANYHKKMAGLKPAMKTMKLLEKHGLMSEDKINYLIDLHNKDPKAINKLVGDSGIDPMDIDSKENDYVPTPRKVNESELVLDEVLAEIKETPTYARTLDVLTKEWDNDSRNVVANNPLMIKVINDQIGSGVYDQVIREVTYQRSIGKLQGISDLEAYKSMGDVLSNAGQLKENISNPGTQKTSSLKPDLQKSAKKETQRKNRKKKVASDKTKGNAPSKIYDPLSMSDEEFANINEKEFFKQTQN